jgi:hypothetical protein
VTDRTRARHVGLEPHHADPSKHPNESGDCAHRYRKLFVLLAKGTEIAKYLTAVVATSAALDSVFRFNRKARTHEALCRRFTELSSKIAGWEPNPANLKKARAERLKIEKDEPPVRRLVDLQAQNEEARSRGITDDNLVPLSRLQRTFGYVFTLVWGRDRQDQRCW